MQCRVIVTVDAQLDGVLDPDRSTVVDQIGQPHLDRMCHRRALVGAHFVTSLILFSGSHRRIPTPGAMHGEGFKIIRYLEAHAHRGWDQQATALRGIMQLIIEALRVVIQILVRFLVWIGIGIFPHAMMSDLISIHDLSGGDAAKNVFRLG